MSAGKPVTKTLEKRFRAVIFDLDGTLIDSIQDIADCMNRVLAARGRRPFKVEEYKLLVGEGREEMVRRVLRLQRPAGPEPSPDEIASVVADYRVQYKNGWKATSRPYPGITELLSGLEALGVRKAVLSNKSHLYTDIIIRELLAPFVFDSVCGAKPGQPQKPDPAPALAIAAGFDLSPAEVVFIGDASIDMQTALAAGMFPAGVLWGFRSRVELVRAGARFLAVHPLDLLPLFS